MGGSGTPIIIRLAQVFFACTNVEDSEHALAHLCEIDIALAGRLASVMNAAVPSSAPLWGAIISHAAEVNRSSGPPLSEADAIDTAANADRWLRQRGA